jgi:hypothetical protein
MKILDLMTGANIHSKNAKKTVLASFLLRVKSVIVINDMKDLVPITWWEKVLITLFAIILLGAVFFIVSSLL